jgi:enolase
MTKEESKTLQEIVRALADAYQELEDLLNNKQEELDEIENQESKKAEKLQEEIAAVEDLMGSIETAQYEAETLAA